MRDDFTQTKTEAAAAQAAGAGKPSSRALFWTVFPSVMLPMFLAVADQTIVATALPRSQPISAGSRRSRGSWCRI